MVEQTRKRAADLNAEGPARRSRNQTPIRLNAENAEDAENAEGAENAKGRRGGWTTDFADYTD